MLNGRILLSRMNSQSGRRGSEVGKHVILRLADVLVSIKGIGIPGINWSLFACEVTLWPGNDRKDSKGD